MTFSWQSICNENTDLRNFYFGRAMPEFAHNNIFLKLLTHLKSGLFKRNPKKSMILEFRPPGKIRAAPALN